MLVYTDSIGYAETYLRGRSEWTRVPIAKLKRPIRTLAEELLPGHAVQAAELPSDDLWRYLLLAKHAEGSQFDALRDLASGKSELPGGILCCADSGRDFHGFKGRPWVAVPGNLHLSAFLRPEQMIEAGGVAFIVLAVVSVLETLDSLPGLTPKPMVKWVNDILVEGAKVGGVLAHVQTQADRVSSAVLGVGLNIEQKPPVAPTRFVPRVGALCEFLEDSQGCRTPKVFDALAIHLKQNYRKLLTMGVSGLLDAYRERSMVIGEYVTIFEDVAETGEREITQGRVRSIGNGLELFLDGVDSPVFKGRLAL